MRIRASKMRCCPPERPSAFPLRAGLTRTEAGEPGQRPDGAENPRISVRGTLLGFVWSLGVGWGFGVVPKGVGGGEMSATSVPFLWLDPDLGHTCARLWDSGCNLLHLPSFWKVGCCSALGAVSVLSRLGSSPTVATWQTSSGRRPPLRSVAGNAVCFSPSGG